MSENQSPLLSDEQVERILESFITARIRRGQEATEQECQDLVAWVCLAIVHYDSLQMLFNGALEIEEFKDGDIQFSRAESIQYHTPLMNQIMEQLEENGE